MYNVMKFIKCFDMSSYLLIMVAMYSYSQQIIFSAYGAVHYS